MNETLDFSKRRRRRKRGLGGWRRLSSGSWQFRVAGYRPDGVPFLLQRTCREADKERVSAECRALAEQYRSGLALPAQRLTLKTFQRQCLQLGFPWSAQNASTWKLLRPLWDYRLSSLDLRTVNKWITRVLYRGDGRPPRGRCGPGYLRHAFELLRRIVKRAVAMRVIAVIPWGDETPPMVPRYSVAHKRREPIPLDDFLRIIESSKNRSESVYIRVLLSAATGMRQHELCRARRSWLLPARDVIGSPVTDGAILSLPGAKRGYSHDVPIAPHIYLEYLSWYETLPSDARATDLLCPVLFKKRWGQSAKWISPMSWDAILSDAGLSDSGYVPYQLRHTRLAQLANDCGPRVAQAIAGHTSVVTTERYTGKARGLVSGAFSFPFNVVSPSKPKPSNTDSKKGKKRKKTRKKSRASTVPNKALLEKLDEVISALKPPVFASSLENAELPEIFPETIKIRGIN